MDREQRTPENGEGREDGAQSAEQHPVTGMHKRIWDEYKREVAYHEAGHAVIAVHVRGEAHYTALELRLPHPEIPPTEWELYQHNPAAFETRADYANWILIALAGHAAGAALDLTGDALSGDGHDDDVSMTDVIGPSILDQTDLIIVDKLVVAASEQLPDLATPAEANDWAETLQVLAKQLVRAYWPAIQTVAATLLTEGQIAGAAVRDLVEATALGIVPAEAARRAAPTQDDTSDQRRAQRLSELEGIEREYRRVLAGELRRVTLTLDESVLLLTLWGRPPRIPGMPPELTSHIIKALEVVPVPDGQMAIGVALLEKLYDLSPGGEAAVIDALERADQMPWNLPHDLRLHKLGLGR